MRKLLSTLPLLAIGAMLENSGPVTRKKVHEDRERANSYEERRERTRHRIEAERQRAAAQRALTTDAEWARIERDEQRRADRKAAKKATRP